MNRHRDLVFRELRRHAPFTAVGALTGIALMLAIVLSRLPTAASHWIFYVLHPLHILFSALATTSIYRRHKPGIASAVVIGYVGAIGLGTLSDVIFPYLGGRLIGAEMHFHVGFVEEWWLVNPLAFAGVALGLWRPTTEVPHFSHRFLSTWASLFYLTAHGTANWIRLAPSIFAILFVAVWLPCCLSDIVFPLLFVRAKPEGSG